MNRLAQILVVLALLGAKTAAALDTERQLGEFAHRVWGGSNGIPTGVMALAQTRDGYLWIASERGLYRFDGIQAQPFDPDAGPKLPSPRIGSLLATRDGRLWVGWRGGVSVLEAGKFTNYGASGGWPPGWVWALAEDRKGRVCAASEGGLLCFEGGRWRVVGNESNFPGARARAVLVDHLGMLWVAAEHRIAVLAPDSSKFELADEFYNGYVTSLTESADGMVWMAETTRAVRPVKRPGETTTSQGMSRAECERRYPDTWQTEPRCQRPDDLEVRVGSMAMLFDNEGSMWITTIGDGLRRAPHPSKLRQAPIGEFSNDIEQYTSKDGLGADYLTAILEDREGNIWVGTRNGLDQFRNSDLVPVNLGSEAIGLQMVPGNDGEVVGMGSGRLYQFRDRYTKPVVANTRMALLYRDPIGPIWATNADGACRLVDLKCAEDLPLPAIGNPNWRLASDKAGRLWAYVQKDGAFVREQGHWVVRQGARPGPAQDAPMTEFTDSTGYMWFGLASGEVVSVKDDRIDTYTKDDGLVLGDVRAIYSGGGHVWVGGGRGLALLRGSRFTSVVPPDAPAFASVSGIVQAGDGSLWLNEGRGVIRIAPAEVAATIRSSAYRPHHDLFTAVDGLQGDTNQYSGFPTAIQGSDGRLWFSTTRGVAWVDPERLYEKNSLPPPVTIQSVVADGTTLSPSAALRISGKTINLQITYTALSLSVPERVQFRYRLTGLDREWQNPGTRRAAYYTRLSPGSYDFQVIASNDAGVWNKTGAELAFRITPAWYQTWWFYTLVGLTAATALTAFYWLRVSQVRADTRRLLEARLSERERIARDLHDTLLQSVQGLMLHFGAVASQIASETPARNLMERTLDRAEKVLVESRDRVKGLRLPSSVAPELSIALAMAGEALELPGTTRLQCAVQGSVTELNPSVREEAFMIAREAMANAAQHSNARNIEVEVNYAAAGLAVRIRDDGRGIDDKVLEQGARAGHWGLSGMRERSALIQARLHIWSRADAGTEIELQVPASVAYRAQPSRKLAWVRRASTAIKTARNSGP